MLVKLSEKEIADCRQAASLRWQLARASNIANQRKDQGRNDDDLDLLGIKAEMCVAKIFEIDHNPFQLGVDSGKDLWLGDISIDVKSTFYNNGKLLFKNIDSFKADCSVLVCQQSHDTFNVVGFCSRKQFKKNSTLMDLGHGVGCVLEQDQLYPLEKLWAHHVKEKLNTKK